MFSNCQVLEDARVLNDGNEDHHANQNAKRSEVDVLYSIVEGKNPRKD